MTSIKRFASPIVLACAALLLCGCFSRQLVRFGTHSRKPVVLLETVDTTNYLLWSDHEHVFWACAENSDTLNCTRRCGGDTDLRCPELSIFQNSGSTNVE